ncbi:sensor domain-containing diguanylate cyclase [Kangiella sediminilitoris]|uniref:diguanylate cyclase n=1 Tax=Kangiella sediminilitoris TaxID=1144748 RepID=A0A1B3B8F0_9GAMM|nr:diguanylate cyclase [Kangiella sediminilitoris]AOE49055.1 Diguanylate cyclase [Kangiella sediminilitoris]
MAAAISATGLYLSTNSIPLLALTLLESTALVIMYRKGVILILADLFFWLLIGIPVVLGIIILFSDITSQDFMQVVLIKQALNGLLNVSIASIFRAFIPIRWYSLSHHIPLPRLSSRIFELSLISIALPSLIITFMLSDSTADRFEEQLSRQLEIRVGHLSELAQDHTEFHLKAIQNLSDVLNHKGHSEDLKQSLLESWNKKYPGFTTMIVADEKGIVTQGSPYETFQVLLEKPVAERDVSDRDYFIEVKKTKQYFVSKVFKGRGFGNDPIIAISTPLLINGEFQGVVEGSLNLPDFEAIDHSGDESSVMVLDESNTVIYASQELGLSALDTLELNETSQPYTNSLAAIEVNGSSYNYKQATTEHGWTIYVLTPFDGLIESYKNDFFGLIIALVVISVLALEVARRFASQVTRPLERLVTYFAMQRPVPRKAATLFSSQEVESVREQLQDSQRLMMDFQHELEEQVEEKTKELRKLNKQLENLSSHDPLTGVLNRRGFENEVDKVYQLACRNKTTVTIAIMDLDKFKNINDTYGHEAGDQCLIEVGKVLHSVFQRETDFVARYGGEEFIVLILGDDVDNHLKLLEKLRQEVAALEVNHSGQQIELTISIGAYNQTEEFSLSYQEMVSKADSLLYASKKGGRNRITSESQ